MNPDLKLTLREAYGKHYDTSELSRDTKVTHDFSMRAWERLTRNLPIGEIDNTVVADFRAAMLAEGTRVRLSTYG